MDSIDIVVVEGCQQLQRNGIYLEYLEDMQYYYYDVDEPSFSWELFHPFIYPHPFRRRSSNPIIAIQWVDELFFIRTITKVLSNSNKQINIMGKEKREKPRDSISGIQTDWRAAVAVKHK